MRHKSRGAAGIGKIRRDDQPAVELPLPHEIDVVAGLVNVVGRGELPGETIVGGGALDKVVADDVELMVGGGMAAHQSGDAPVVHDVVDELNRTPGPGIVALIVDPEIVAERDVGGGPNPCAVASGFERFADEAILESERVAFLRHTEAVPAAPLD